MAQIQYAAFVSCSILTSITYKVTLSEWGKVVKYLYWNVGIADCTIYCTDGEIAKDSTVTYK